MAALHAGAQSRRQGRPASASSVASAVVHSINRDWLRVSAEESRKPSQRCPLHGLAQGQAPLSDFGAGLGSLPQGWRFMLSPPYWRLTQPQATPDLVQNVGLFRGLPWFRPPGFRPPGFRPNRHLGFRPYRDSDIFPIIASSLLFPSP